MTIQKIQHRRTIIVTLMISAITVASISNAYAGSTLRKGVKGAAAGDLVGAVIGGSDGAAKGALIGGGVGLVKGASDNRRHKRHKNRAKQYRR